MPIPAQRDLDTTRAALQRWFANRLAEAGDAPVTDVAISEFNAPTGSGYSNETLLADVTWKQREQDRSDSIVVRIEPKGYKVFMEADFALQHRMLTTLDKQSDVRVPPTLWFEEDASILGARFFVMRRVNGAAPPDVPNYNAEGVLFDYTPAERRQLWENAINALIGVHKVPLETVAFLNKPELGETGFDQIFEYWRRSYEWAARGKAQPVAQAAWEWMNANMPTNRPTALSWGDARLGNILFDGLDVGAVVDWEMLSLGGHEMDLGWWLFLDAFQEMGQTHLEGMGTHDETVAMWEAGTGEKAENLHWYEVFAGFRFAIVMMRIMQMYEEWGVLPAEGPDPELDNPVTRLLAQLLGIDPFPS
jgi:aminoglycoside phosphotransferase (APT) family kinase protein